jgi:hypothetical protein
MEKHFVQFLSPGTFVSECSEKPIDAWDVDAAVRMARDIKERHGARPYGFRFVTYQREDDDLNSHETARGSIHYLGGRIETRDQVEARNDPNEHILLQNMRSNDIKHIIVNDNSWRFTGEFRDDEVLLDVVL